MTTMRSLSKNPLNLLVRFLLELAALACFASWGWHQGTGSLSLVYAIGLPLIAATVWGVFRVDGDPKKAPVRVPGIVRFVIEILYFTLAIVALYNLKLTTLGAEMAIATILHYFASYDRVRWLLRQ